MALFGDDPKLYKERNIWSQQHLIWSKLEVIKPRLPTREERGLPPEEDEVEAAAATDPVVAAATVAKKSSAPPPPPPPPPPLRWRDDQSLWPTAFLLFVGEHNEKIVKSLVKLTEEFEDDKRSPSSLIVYGARGSGKTAMVHVLLKEYCSELDVTDGQKKKWILVLDAAQHVENFYGMWDTVKKFVTPAQERFLRNVGFRIVVIDNADALTVNAQQTLRKLLDTYIPAVHFIFVCSDIGKLTQYVQQVSVKLRSKAMGEQDTLAWVLKFLFRRKVGYNREGIQMLFKACKDRSLTAMLDLLQDTFLQRDFISAENILRVWTGAPIKVDLPEIPFTRVIEPVQRCRICTLYPPCNHTDLQALVAVAKERRDELPYTPPPTKKGGGKRQSVGAAAAAAAPPQLCWEYTRYGKCSAFNQLGRCKYNHPKTIHKIIEEPRRCERCSIPWPCDHCAYHADRNSLIALIARLKVRLKRLKQAAAKEPPMALSFLLEERDPDWKDVVKYLDDVYTTDDKVEVFKAITTWLENAFCTDSELYIRRERFLLREFGEVVDIPLLDDPPKRDKK